MKSKIFVVSLTLFSVLAMGLVNINCGGNDAVKISVHPYCSLSAEESDTQNEQSSSVKPDDNIEGGQHYGFASIYGKMFNGLDGSSINYKTHSRLEAKVVYSSGNGLKTIKADVAKDENGYFTVNCIPTDTVFNLEINDSSLISYYYTHSAITDNTYGDTGGNGIYENDPNDFGRVLLYPNDINPGDITLKLYDNATGESLSSASGTVLLSPTNLTASDLMDYNTGWLNDYYTLAPKLTATIANGTALITGTDLVLGATYDIQVYGVSGYQYNVATSQTAGAEVSTTVNINMTASDSSSSDELILLSITNVTASSAAAPTYFHSEFDSTRSMVFTFNQNVDVDVSQLKGVDGDAMIILDVNSRGNEDGDGNTNAPAGVEGVGAGNLTGFLSATPSTSAAVLTITFAADTVLLNGGTLDADDNLWYDIQELLKKISIKRSVDLADKYQALNTFNRLDLNSDGVIDVGPLSVDNALDFDADNQADFLVRYPYP